MVLGGGGGWWIFVDGGGLYLWVVAVGCAVYGGVLLKVLSFFFRLLLRFLDLELVGGSGDCGCNLCRVVVVVVVVPVVPGWWRLSLSCVFVYCWFLNKYIILIPCIYYFNL